MIINIEFFRKLKWRLTLNVELLNVEKSFKKHKFYIIMSNQIPRGIHNNNPLNIRRSKARQGDSRHQEKDAGGKYSRPSLTEPAHY